MELKRSERNLVLGVDPGLSGALAFVEVGERCKLISVQDMPLFPSPAKREIDVTALASSIDAYSKQTRFAVIEDVHAMTYIDARGERRGQGAAASFAFGKAAGIAHGIIASCMIPSFFVKPSVWKVLMGLSSNKNLSREKASKLFPGSEHHWKRAKDDGRAEAALLAYFGAQKFWRGH
jgi:crossover junction endodeoxyribonuclease RuvC